MGDVVYITVVNESSHILLDEEIVQFVEVGIQGPPGPQGEPGPEGEETVPTFPIVDPKSSTNVAAGTSVNLDSALVSKTKTGKVQQITLSSSVTCKWEIKKSSEGVDTTLDVIFTSGNNGNTPSHEWEPPHRDYTELLGNGMDTFYRVTATNLDARNAANVYSTFFFDEVDEDISPPP